MKLSVGGVSNLVDGKKARIMCERHRPEIFGLLGGVVITLLGRHLYKTGAEDSLNAENKALAEIGCIEDYDPKKDKFKAKVLK